MNPYAVTRTPHNIHTHTYVYIYYIIFILYIVNIMITMSSNLPKMKSNVRRWFTYAQQLIFNRLHKITGEGIQLLENE